MAVHPSYALCIPGVSLLPLLGLWVLLHSVDLVPLLMAAWVGLPLLGIQQGFVPFDIQINLFPPCLKTYFSIVDVD